MTDVITPLAGWCAVIVEAIGVGLITVIALYALFDALVRLSKKEEKETVFQELRQHLGRASCSDWSSSSPRTSFIRWRWSSPSKPWACWPLLF